MNKEASRGIYGREYIAHVRELIEKHKMRHDIFEKPLAADPEYEWKRRGVYTARRDCDL